MPSSSSLFVTPTLAPPELLSLAPLSTAPLFAPPNAPLTLTSQQYQNFRDGFNAGLVFLQTTADTAALGKNLPIVGTHLKDASQFFTAIKAQALSAFTDLDDDVTYTDQAIRDKLQAALLSVLPGPIDILSLNGGSGQIQFNFNFQEALTEHAVDLDFESGIAGLGLDIQSTLRAKTSYGIKLGFGIDLSQGDRFYIDTTQDQISIGLDINAVITGSGKLGFLQLNAQQNATSPTRFLGNFSIDLQDSDGFLTVNEFAAAQVQATLDAVAKVAIDMTLGFGNDANFPSLKTDFRLDWEFVNANLSAALIGNSPDVRFDNLRLDLGQFFSNFVNPIVAQINQVLDPIRPILKILDQKMPVLSDIDLLRSQFDTNGNGEVSLIEVVKKLSDNPSLKFIDAAIEIDKFIQKIPTGLGSTYLSIGDLRLLDNVSDVRSLSKLSDVIPNSLKNIKNIQAELQAIGSAASNIKVANFLTNTKSTQFSDSSGAGLLFPILESPSTAFGLLLGRDVSLFAFDMPKLEASFEMSEFFPILGPLGVRLSGSFDAKAKFAFGYDTFGLRKYAEQGYTDESLIFNGFYVSDTNAPDGSGIDVPEITLTASIKAAGEINVVVASAGVGGGIFAKVNGNLHKNPTKNANPQDPNAIGKIRISELADNFAEGPLCIFDIDGEMTAGLNAYIKVGVDLGFTEAVLWEDSYDIASVKLLDFSHVCKDDPQQSNPILAQWVGNPSDGLLRLNMGDYAIDRNFAGHSNDDAESFKVDNVNGDTVIRYLGFTQTFMGVKKIIAEAGKESDTIDIAAEVMAEVELWGDFKDPARPDFGNDKITTGGGKATVYGGKGNDELTARNGDAKLYGEAGEDKLIGGRGNDELYGGTENDKLYGNDGNDLLFGGDGNDFLSGGSGNDTLRGENGTDRLKGDRGNDTLYGNAGVDILEGGDDDDVIYGGTGNDILIGDNGNIPVGVGQYKLEPGTSSGNGNDRLFGEDGNDALYGIGGNDELIGADGDDVLDGGDGNDTVLGDVGSIANGVVTLISGNGNDRLSGGRGDDRLFGQDGNDELYGNGDQDQLVGGNGNDYLDGGDGNDIVLGDVGSIANGVVTLISGSGNDRLFGGAGNDRLYGQAGRDIVFGDRGQITALPGVEEIRSIDPSIGGDDSLYGNEDLDILVGGSGNDTLVGGTDASVDDGTNDILFGDNAVVRKPFDTAAEGSLLASVESIAPTFGGMDVITAQGDDQIIGGSGGSDAKGVGGDTLIGSNRNNIILGDNGRVTRDQNGNITQIETLLDDQGGDDWIQGGAGKDVILGQGGNDRLIGGSNAANNPDDIDYLFGGADDDAIAGNNASITNAANPANRVITNLDNALISNFIFGDEGSITFTGYVLNSRGLIKPILNHTVQLAQSAIASLDGNDSLYGSDARDYLFGGNGNDRILAQGGDDLIFGDNGRMVFANSIAQRLSSTDEAGGLDTVDGGSGADVILGGDQGDRLFGGNGNDVVIGDQGYVDFVYAGDARINADSNAATIDFVSTVVSTRGGNDVIYGNGGNDTLLGGTGSDTIWGDDGTDLEVLDINWENVGAGDFNQDGKTDLLWRDRRSGELKVRLMNGVQIIGEQFIEGRELDWKLAAWSDFDNDGKLDLLWRNQITGKNEFWWMNGSTVTSTSEILQIGDQSWQIAAAADMDRNGTIDLLWRNYSTGANAFWLLDRGKFKIQNSSTAYTYGTDENTSDALFGYTIEDTNWIITGAGDLDGDGSTELFWRHAQLGLNAVWKMNKTQLQSGYFTTTVGAGGWWMTSSGDFNQDGLRDWVWRERQTGQTVVWYMDPWNIKSTGVFTEGYSYDWIQEPNLSPENSEDLLLGDYGIVYPGLQRDRNYFSTNITDTITTGNDELHGDQGYDILMGQQGDDRLYGGTGEDDLIGGHNVIGGVDGSDRIDGGADADVAIGDNGTITRRRLPNGRWEQYPAPFVSTIRDVQLWDDIDRIGGNDTLLGSSGDDRLWGQRGNDTMDGGYGDDELIGGLGNDRISGGFGQDTALGDVGIILRAYDSSGKPQINQDGSWHRDVVLLDTAALVASYQLNQLPQSVFQSNQFDSLLLSGAYNADGSRVLTNGIWDTQAIAVKAFKSGDDTIFGNAGNDSLYGQGGNDTIDGGSGSDTIEGNAGNDTLNGGEGDDLVIGDNSFSAVSYGRDLPVVTRGYQIIEQATGLGFDLDAVGAIVIPTMKLLPQTSESLLTQMTLLNSGVTNQTLRRNGKSYRSLISLTPSLQDHLDQYAGNDTVADVGGRNTLVGDDYANYQPIRTGVTTIDTKLDSLNTLLYHTTYDLHDLELALGTGKPGQTLRYGNDTLIGGRDADSLYGDNLTIYSPLMVKAPQDITKLDRQVDEFSQLLQLLNQSVSNRLSGFSQAQTQTILDAQNDTISGGEGDDYLMGGDSLTFAPVLDGLLYDRTQFWNYGFTPIMKAVRPTFRDWNWQRNNDLLSGNDGNDFLIGGYSNLIAPILTQTPMNAVELGRLQASLGTLVSDFKNRFLRDLYNQRYGIAYENRDRSNSLTLENDTLSGGNGNDVLLGDNATIVLPFLNGAPNLSIKIQGNNLDVTEEAHNFFGGTPHRADLTLRTLANLPIGRDALYGGSGTDVLLGQRGADVIQGGDDYDTLFGGLEGDTLSDSGANLIRYYTLPSPSDEVAIAPYLQPKLQLWLSTHLTKTFLEILTNRYSASLSGDLTLNFGS